jgi:hypothetical protein
MSFRAMRSRWSLALCALALCFGAARAHAESSAGIGPHLGLNFAGADPVFAGAGARFSIYHINSEVDLQFDPSLAWYFVESATVLHFALSIPVEWKLPDSVLRPFAGGGLSLFYVHENHHGDLRPRLNLIGGLAFALEAVKPFVELRIILGHGSAFELLGGVFFNL